MEQDSCDKYPMCLYFLDLLQYEHFRREVVSSQCTKFIDDQQILLWQHYTRRRTRLLQKQAEESTPGGQNNSHPPVTANGTGNGFNCNSQTNGQGQPVQKVP
ncbi:Mediator of RNA polymerase II transcription subunit 31 [Frankliniella fusca]|uniref:Mediator of RNA polymerase II transcription subunit 31 n=1 Tax=Frankliniella fusca TaxID=407009 RepID=A0AAE1HU56_9NEOP|nr:Mediator of RNA polymerase II transcription subunit 31 [Frankliniella fusca]